MIDACVVELEPILGTGAACRAAGKSKATHYRRWCTTATAPAIRQLRAKTLDAAYAANPSRFRHRRPSPPKLPTVAAINKPTIGNDAQRKA